MPKQFVRGAPPDPEGQHQIVLIRQLFERDKAEIDAMFPEGYDLFDLVNGEVELVAGEEVLRCYGIPADNDYVALIIDDYHPDDDANLKVDDAGNVTNPEDE